MWIVLCWVSFTVVYKTDECHWIKWSMISSDIQLCIANIVLDAMFPLAFEQSHTNHFWCFMLCRFMTEWKWSVNTDMTPFSNDITFHQWNGYMIGSFHGGITQWCLLGWSAMSSWSWCLIALTNWLCHWGVMNVSGTYNYTNEVSQQWQKTTSRQSIECTSRTLQY